MTEFLHLIRTPLERRGAANPPVSQRSIEARFEHAVGENTNPGVHQSVFLKITGLESFVSSAVENNGDF